MRWPRSHRSNLVPFVALVALSVSLASARFAAQTALGALGLTEATARTFVLNDVKGPALNRRSDIAVAGTRAFLALPPSARAAAATGLFAWAKSYVSSPAFTAAYAQHRTDVGLGTATPQANSIDAEVKARIDADLEQLAASRKEAEAMPPEVRGRMLEGLKAMEENLRSPQTAAALRAEFAASRGTEIERNSDLEQRLPADPKQFVARRLTEFLEAIDAPNFSARTIALTGGPDGIEFVDRADRQRPWMWQLAVIVGAEATGAARTAARAWLAEVQR